MATASIRVTGNTTEAIAALERLGIKAEETGKKTESALGNSKLQNIGKVLAAGVLGAGVASIKMAGDFQSSMTSLATGAGESHAAVGKVSKAILDMAPAVGTSTKQLANGMYMIESAGFHGADGLKVLKAAAEGAKVGNADLGTVADAVTTVLNDYGLKSGSAAEVTSKLVATVAAGKTHMQDLAGALAAVMPAASSAHVGLGEVLGAMATMTSKGTPAADSATYLRQTILQLSNPSKKASDEMNALGLSAIDVSSGLGRRGLVGTMELLSDAIAKKMGPNGIVLLNTMNQIRQASTAAQLDISKLPPGMAQLAQSYERGGVSATAWKDALAKATPEQAKLMMAVAAATAKQDIYQAKLGGMHTAQQTYVGALADMVGGTKSMQAALELTGASADTFSENVNTINSTTAAAKGHVQGWADVQKDFNFKLAQAKETVETLAIRLGNFLIPVVERVAKVLSQAIGWLERHKAVAIALAAVVGGFLVVAITAYTVGMISAAAATIAATWPILAIIAGIAALVVGIYELVTHWKEVWGFIKRILGDAVDWIKAHWQLLVAIFTGPIGAVVMLIVHFRDQIIGFFGNIVDFVASVPGKIVSFFESLPGDIMKGIGSLLDDFVSFGEKIVHAIVKGIGNMAGDVGGAIKGVVNSIPGVGSVAKVLGFAEGGVVPGPTGQPRLAVVHGGEIITPPKILQGGYTPGPPLPSSGQGQSGGMTQNFITVNSPSATSSDIGTELTWALNRRTT